MSRSTGKTPHKQIRAVYDSTTITVYQAYSSEIATAAVSAQKLNAHSGFRMTRMTWIKPSFLWCMYRSGWSYKDPRQSNILAISMTRVGFETLLSLASVNHSGQVDTTKDVRVQWDPERDIDLNKLDYRSIQIGIGPAIVQRWIDEMVVNIEDVTDKAREWERRVKLGEQASVVQELPAEREYPLPDEIRASITGE
ncbi:hypothetical protein BOTBODRAFT_176279 [Botryobasidium botryosum FD-172 SS1]|uniref:DUF4291 domain-containing protein n=1 Tax=Botryobasidium botryosum (strain FD-172 SS1) TaxID=930990 RepID=A0A067MAI7_BOTB1|nr:hypothetical protein BOTBODRAFT_176279 [Botryobasidium botryosum FD-172 SS1]